MAWLTSCLTWHNQVNSHIQDVIAGMSRLPHLDCRQTWLPWPPAQAEICHTPWETHSHMPGWWLSYPQPNSSVGFFYNLYSSHHWQMLLSLLEWTTGRLCRPGLSVVEEAASTCFVFTYRLFTTFLCCTRRLVLIGLGEGNWWFGLISSHVHTI